MHDERLAVRVGFAVIAGLAIAAVLLTQMTDRRFGSRVRVTVRFGHNGGLEEGADVQVAGRVIGEVRTIRLDRATRSDDGELGVLMQVAIEADKVHMVPVNGEWFVNSKGIFGERYLEVGPPPGNGPWERTIVEGDDIRGIDPARIDRLAAMSLQNITTMRHLAKELLPQWRELTRQLDELSATLDELAPEAALDSAAAMIDEAGELGRWWDDAGVELGDVGAVAERGERVFERARREIAGLRDRIALVSRQVELVGDRFDPERLARFRDAADRAERILAKLDETIAVAEDLAAYVAAGRGTVGGLMNDTEFADFAKLMNKTMKRRPWELVGTQRPD